MIYSNNTGITANIILTEVARFRPSPSVPASLKKTVIAVCNNILNKSKKLDREDAKVDRALKAIESAIVLAKDNSYKDNAYSVEIHSVITNGEACMDYAVSSVRDIGFKHSNMKEGKKGQTWYKVSGNDILVATIIGTLFGNSMATIILHAVENSDHNNDILNGVLESTALTEGRQAEEYKARKAKEAEDKKKAEDARNARRRFTAGYSKPADEDNVSEWNRENKARKMVHNERRNREIKMTSALTNPNSSSKDKQDAIKHSFNADKQITAARDATNRHIRRHPKQYKEGTIFESVEFI